MHANVFSIADTAMADFMTLSKNASRVLLFYVRHMTDRGIAPGSRTITLMSLGITPGVLAAADSALVRKGFIHVNRAGHWVVNTGKVYMSSRNSWDESSAWVLFAEEQKRSSPPNDIKESDVVVRNAEAGDKRQMSIEDRIKAVEEEDPLGEEISAQVEAIASTGREVKVVSSDGETTRHVPNGVR